MLERRPTKPELAAAVGNTVPDVIAPGLAVLFCGINPGLYSAATGHHFARPGNRFWPALQAAGFTDHLLRPWEERRLLESGVGITNLVKRATAAAAELAPEELRKGRWRWSAKSAATTREPWRYWASARIVPPSVVPRPGWGSSRTGSAERCCGFCRIRVGSTSITSSRIWRRNSGCCASSSPPGTQAERGDTQPRGDVMFFPLPSHFVHPGDLSWFEANFS